MKTKNLILILIFIATFLAKPYAQDTEVVLLSPVISNSDLLSIKLPDIVISSAELDEGGSFTKVLGVIGKEIKFEILLPVQWNSRFVMGGGGGFVEGIQNSARFTVNQGFATAGTNTGHEGLTLQADWAYNNMERQLNFGHLAIHRTAVVSKTIIDLYYGISPMYSYFMGCSRGGGQALIEAQRYPEDFDGIIAGAPVINWPSTLAKFINNAQILFPDPNDLSSSPITEQHVLLLHKFILEQCDELDGIKDNILNDPNICNPDLTLLMNYRDEEDMDLFFSLEQVNIIKKLYSKLIITGEEIHPGYPLGSESEWWGWIAGPYPYSMTLNFPSNGFAFGTEGAKYLFFNDPEWDYSTYDFSNFVSETEYAAAFLNATSTDYSDFKEKGGKMIIYHGLYDAGLSSYTSIEHYEAAKNQDNQLEDYIRLFLLPGVQHCGGGPGPASAGWLGLISDWVENGAAPERVILTKRSQGEILMSRPVFPYPIKAVYDKIGNPNDERSFIERKE